MVKVSAEREHPVSSQNLKSYFLSLLCLGLVLLVGYLIRLHNISDYLFYPDSYQNLLVAKNISENISVVGSLGKGGMEYPPYFIWTRPIYPILIFLTSKIINSQLAAASGIAFFMGMCAVPLSYVLVKSIFSSQKAGLAGALMTAVSFNHTVWSGFIMSETTGITFTFIFLILLIKYLHRNTKLFDIPDLFTGLVLALTVFSRYEYFLYLVGVIIFILNTSNKAYLKIINILTGLVITSAFIIALIFPIGDSIRVFITQIKDVGVVAMISITILVVLFLIYEHFRDHLPIDKVKLLTGSFFITAGILIAILPYIHLSPPIIGFIGFLRTDFLIGSLCFIGIGLLMKQKLNIVVLVLTTTIINETIYWRINPFMQRYTVNLLPYLIIPASYAAIEIINKIKHLTKAVRVVSAALVILVLLIQTYNSHMGMNTWDNGIWFIESYEQQSAKKIGQFLTDNDTIIAAFPEPYYYFTGHTTLPVSSEYPYIDNKLVDQNSELIFINDHAMKDLYPGFSHLLENNFRDQIIGSYRITSSYRYRSDIVSLNDNEFVTVYRINGDELIGKFY